MKSGSGYLICSWLALLLSVAQGLYAQQAVLKGTVTNQNGEELVGVTVLASERGFGTSTGPDGVFSLVLPANKRISVSFSYVGYDSLVIADLLLKEAEIKEMQVVLEERVTILKQIEIESERNRRDVSVVNITPRSAQLLPSAFGDFSKILSTIPGVVANNELSSSYSVRGGNFDENLVYLNGFEVYRPFLVRAGRQEGLSVINADLVREASFHAGGWNAFFGDKLSSVLDVTYKEPEDFKGSLSIGLLGGSAHIEGVTKNEKFSYLLGARNKRSQYLLNSLEVKGEYFPSFTDFQGFFHFNPGSGHTGISLFTSYARNRYRVEPVTRETEFGTFNEALRFLVAFEGQELLNYDTWQTGLKMDQKIAANKTLTVTASGVKTFEKEYSEVEGGYRLCDVNKNPGSATFNECISIRGIGTNFFHARNTLEGTLLNTDVSMRQNLGPAGIIQYGLGFDRVEFKDYIEEYRFIDSADFVSVTSRTFGTASMVSNAFNGFFRHTFTIGSHGELGFGVRATYRDLNNQWLFSPRAQYSFKPDWQRDYLFKISAGHYAQQPLYREMRSFSGILNTSLRAQQSVHFIAGLDHNFTMWARPFKWTSEVYYKYLWDVIPYDVDNVRIRYFAENMAVAYAAGLDTRIGGEFIPATESWFSMSLMSTKEDLENDDRGYIRRPTDQRLTIAAVFEDHLPNNPSLRVNLGLLFGSGLPFGPPEDFDNRSAFHGDSYQRVDIGFSKILVLDAEKKQSLVISLKILNLTGINNAISYTWIQDIGGNYLAVPNTLSNRFINFQLSVQI